MSPTRTLEVRGWRTDEHNLLRRRSAPDSVQELLDSLPYRCESGHFSALSALRDKRAHCFDGALLAAAALLRGRFEPMLIDLCAEQDDDHVICAYRWKGYWGAVAKSNFPGLRFREPIFRTPRELVLSYFEFYFSMSRYKSLRRFSKPLRLPHPSKLDWECNDDAADRIVSLLNAKPHYPVLSPAQRRLLRKVDKRLYQSQLLGVDLEGVY